MKNNNNQTNIYIYIYIYIYVYVLAQLSVAAAQSTARQTHMLAQLSVAAAQSTGRTRNFFQYFPMLEGYFKIQVIETLRKQNFKNFKSNSIYLKFSWRLH